MAVPENPQLSLAEKLDLSSKILRSLPGIFLSLFTSPFRGKDGASTYYKHFVYSTMRNVLSRMTIRQNQSLAPGTDDAYTSFAKSHKFTRTTVTLEDGTHGHWLGSDTAEKVIVYFHGGGYVLPANNAQFKLLSGIKDKLNHHGHDVAVLVLSYTVAPKAQYPRQLQQAVALVKHVVQVAGKKPSNIILCGDSAGGNLALGVLSHLTHPHPDIPKLELSENLGAAVLLSPWCAFSTIAPSYASNKNKDLLDAVTLTKWSAAFMGQAPPDFYNQPATAPTEWWRDLKVDEVLIVAGKDELLVDDIEVLAKRIQDAHTKITTAIVADEAHDQPLMDILLGYKEPGEGLKTVHSWLASRL